MKVNFDFYIIEVESSWGDKESWTGISSYVGTFEDMKKCHPHQESSGSLDWLQVRRVIPPWGIRILPLPEIGGG